MSPRYEPRSAAGELSERDKADSWIARDVATYGRGGVRRRQTCDHEAIHCAAAVALGWTVTRVAVYDADNGACEYERRSGRDDEQIQREELVLTVAPRALGASRSSGDAQDAMRLAATIAAKGQPWFMAASGDTSRVLDEALRAARRIAETSQFKTVRKVVREALDERGAVDRGDVEIIAGVASPRRVQASAPRTTKTTPKAKPSAKPQARTKTARASKGCGGCGFTYTPKHASGFCGTCRRASRAA
jgi:hypothetical protein